MMSELEQRILQNTFYCKFSPDTKSPTTSQKLVSMENRFWFFVLKFILASCTFMDGEHQGFLRMSSVAANCLQSQIGCGARARQYCVLFRVWGHFISSGVL